MGGCEALSRLRGTSGCKVRGMGMGMERSPGWDASWEPPDGSYATPCTCPKRTTAAKGWLCMLWRCQAFLLLRVYPDEHLLRQDVMTRAYMHCLHGPSPESRTPCHLATSTLTAAARLPYGAPGPGRHACQRHTYIRQAFGSRSHGVICLSHACLYCMQALTPRRVRCWPSGTWTGTAS